MASSANASRDAPRLQTSSTAGSSRQHQARFSWDETPQELRRQPYPAPSPTNSTIEESPISPVSPSNDLPSYDLQHNARSTPLPDEKALEANMQAPPSRMHPAYSAPIAEQPTPASQQTTMPAAPPVSMHPAATPQDPPQSPGPLPVKKPEDGYPMTPLTNSTTSPQPSKYAIERPDAYNPRSLQGPNVSTANHRPGQVAHPNSSIDSNWKHGMCEPDALCCMGTFCPCLLYGKTMYRLSKRSEKKDPTDLLGYESCNGSCGLFAIGCGFQGLSTLFFFYNDLASEE